MQLNKKHFDKVREDLSNDTLSLSYSKLNAFLHSPRQFVKYYNSTYMPSESMNIGTAVHELFLEDGLQLIEVLPPDAPSRPSERQINAKKKGESTIKSIKFWDEWGKKKYLVTQSGLGQAERMVDNINRNREAVELKQLAEHIEKKIEFQYKGWRVTGKADIIGKDNAFVCDLKTTKDVLYYKFRRSIFDYNYHLQAAIYCAASGCDSFYWIVVDKDDCLVYECGEQLLNMGVSLFHKAIKKFNECVAMDYWEQGREFWLKNGIIDI